MVTYEDLSIILPSKDEAKNIARLLPSLVKLYPGAEIIVVDDGSTDNTLEVCRAHNISVLAHPYSKGNGAAIKAGARIARGKVIAFMDGDGQHRVEDLPALLEEHAKGYDMVVGSRTNAGQANIGRLLANKVYNNLASWIVGHRIKDLTSGFRVVDKHKFREFLHLLPNGFSYPTTITMAFFRAGYSICYVPIQTNQRSGKSHLKPSRDGLRFFIIVFRIGTLYSPLKVFLPISIVHFLIGSGYYAYSYYSYGRFTNMTALLLTTAIVIFLIGLVSEQITNLLYSRKEN